LFLQVPQYLRNKMGHRRIKYHLEKDAYVSVVLTLRARQASHNRGDSLRALVTTTSTASPIPKAT
jgi:TusA-related sulfurtransferase